MHRWILRRAREELRKFNNGEYTFKGMTLEEFKRLNKVDKK
jgi:hypothetical protein